MVNRWKFRDLTGVLPPYQFRRNPSEMSSPYPVRNLTTEHASSGLDGRPLSWEGPPTLQDMTFNGTLVDEQDWKDFLTWVYRSKGHVEIEDHLGRVMDVVMVSFAPELKPGIQVVNGQQRPFYGKYTITCRVYSVSDMGARRA